MDVFSNIPDSLLLKSSFSSIVNNNKNSTNNLSLSCQMNHKRMNQKYHSHHFFLQIYSSSVRHPFYYNTVLHVIMMTMFFTLTSIPGELRPSFCCVQEVLEDYAVNSVLLFFVAKNNAVLSRTHHVSHVIVSKGLLL